MIPSTRPVKRKNAAVQKIFAAHQEFFTCEAFYRYKTVGYGFLP
jgi:hypothetical protein